MRILVAMDSFKGSLSSLEAGEAARRGILRAMPDADVRVRPLADGGEGTVEALTRGLGGRRERVRVTGPLGKPVICEYGIVDTPAGSAFAPAEAERRAGSAPAEAGREGAVEAQGGDTAIIEMSGAAGLTLVSAQERDPLRATSFGVGELIRDAIAKGCRRFIEGIGGSATNDGGAGMLQALGFGLRNARGEQIPLGARGLAELVKVEAGGALPELAACSFRVACDVTNPLCGPRGASAVYGPQKGATPEMVARLDAWLARFAELAAQSFPGADPEHPGAGAAGGLGFALMCFLGARLGSGVGIVLEETRLAEELRRADIVVTGEGRLDAQSAMGKAPAGVAALARRCGKPALALCGCVGEGAELCHAEGIDAYFPIPRGPISPEEAMLPGIAARNLAATAEQVFRLLGSVGRQS